MKKILSLALALALVLTLTVPAFAGSTTTTPTNATEFTGSTEAPTVSVTVPASATFVVNPYKMSVQNAAGDDVTDQVVAATQYVTNLSDVPLTVDVTVTGTTEGNAAFATSSTQGSRAPTTNSVFLYAEFGAATANDGSADPTWGTAYSTTATNQVLVGARATSKKGVAKLAATDGSAANYLAYKLAGDAASAPTTAWTDADKVKVSVAFTFTAGAIEAVTPPTGG